MRGVGAPSRWSLVDGRTGQVGGGGEKSGPRMQTGATTTTVWMSPVGVSAAGRLCSRRFPSAKCRVRSRGQDRARRGAGLVAAFFSGGNAQSHKIRKKGWKNAKQKPKMEGPGVAKRMRLEIVDSSRVR